MSDKHAGGRPPKYNNAEEISAAINRIKNLPIPEEAKRGILGDNLREALGIK